MVKWETAQRGTTTLFKGFKGNLQEEAAENHESHVKVRRSVKPKVVVPQTPQLNPLSFGSATDQEKLVKVITELAISGRQKKDLMQELEKERKEKEELENAKKKIEHEHQDLTLKYEKSVTCLKIFKKYIKKNKQKRTNETTASFKVMENEIANLRSLLEQKTKELMLQRERDIKHSQEKQEVKVAQNASFEKENKIIDKPAKKTSDSDSNSFEVLYNLEYEGHTKEVNDTNLDKRSREKIMDSSSESSLISPGKSLRSSLQEIVRKQQRREVEIQTETIRENQTTINEETQVDFISQTKETENKGLQADLSEVDSILDILDHHERVRNRGFKYIKRTNERPKPKPAIRLAKNDRKDYFTKKSIPNRSFDLEDDYLRNYSESSSSMINGLGDVVAELESNFEYNPSVSTYKEKPNNSLDEALQKVIEQLNVL